MSVLILSREYSSAGYSEHGERALSFSVESTRHLDTPNPRSENSRSQSSVLGFAAVITITRADSATGVLVYIHTHDDNSNIQAATVRPAQRTTVCQSRLTAQTRAPTPRPIPRPARGLLRHSAHRGQSHVPCNLRHHNARIPYIQPIQRTVTHSTCCAYTLHSLQ